MISFLLSSANTPFTISLAVMMLMALLEMVSVGLGMGISQMLDSLIPDFDADIDLDADADMADAGGSGALVKLLAWFRIGEVPALMLLIILLTGFGLSGLTIQFAAANILGRMLPLSLAVVPAVVCGVGCVRVCGGFLGKYMPKDETYAVSEKSFIGKVATITTGTARAGKPAQAKIKDRFGQSHYILVVPDNPEESFATGEQGIVVSQNGPVYKIIANTSSSLTD